MSRRAAGGGGPSRRDCLASLGAFGAGASGFGASGFGASGFGASGAFAPVLPAAAAAPAGQGVFLAGGWVLTAADLAALGPAAPPGARIAAPPARTTLEDGLPRTAVDNSAAG